MQPSPLLLLLPALALAGHNDMFACRGRSCDVEELTEANWAAKLAEQPYFIMFYAPWCGHCKQLAPKLKGAAKKAKGLGFGIGAVDVEPNPSIQSMFPDIKGFPSLKYVNHPKGKKSIDYNGPREGDDVLQWTKDTFVRTGGALQAPIEHKAWSELYTFFGRAALDDLPVLFAVGSDKEPPKWLASLHGDLKEKPKTTGENPEAETQRLLGEAKKATKLPEVREGIVGVLETLTAAEKARNNKRKALYSTTYSSDPETVTAFNASGAPKNGAHVFALSVDRKNLANSLVVAYGNNPVEADRRGKLVDAASLLAFARDAAANFPRDTAVALPDVPKPKSVLAAEERAAARKKRATAVHAIASKGDLDANCYALPAAKTCVVGVGASESDLTELAAKYSKEGYAFSTVASDAPVADALRGDVAAPALVVVKGGKRPRAARAALSGGAALLDSIAGGGASFAKFSGGLPAWPEEAEPEEPAAEEGEGDEYDL